MPSGTFKAKIDGFRKARVLQASALLANPQYASTNFFSDEGVAAIVRALLSPMELGQSPPPSKPSCINQAARHLGESQFGAAAAALSSNPVAILSPEVKERIIALYNTTPSVLPEPSLVDPEVSSHLLLTPEKLIELTKSAEESSPGPSQMSAAFTLAALQSNIGVAQAVCRACNWILSGDSRARLMICRS